MDKYRIWLNPPPPLFWSNCATRVSMKKWTLNKDDDNDVDATVSHNFVTPSKALVSMGLRQRKNTGPT